MSPRRLFAVFHLPTAVVTWGMFVSLIGVWGASFLFIKISLEALPPLTVVALRLTLGALLVWTVVWVTGTPVREIPWRAITFMGMVNNALPFTLLTWGEQHIPSGLASLVVGSSPIFAAILSHYLLREERLSLKQWSGVVLGFVGLFVLFTPDVRAAVQGLRTWWGVLGQVAVMGTAFCYGLGTVYARRTLRGYPPFLMAALQLSTAALVIWPLAIIAGVGNLSSAMTPRVLLAVGWLGFASSGLAYILYYILIRRMGATQLITVTYLIPVVGLVLGALVLGEALTPISLLALVLILAGVVVVHRLSEH